MKMGDSGGGHSGPEAGHPSIGDPGPRDHGRPHAGAQTGRQLSGLGQPHRQLGLACAADRTHVGHGLGLGLGDGVTQDGLRVGGGG